MRLLPLLFALLWSTGFIGARFGLPYIEPFTFLAIRLLIAVIVLYGFIFIFKIKFPRLNNDYFHVFGSGLFIHVAYLGRVFSAIKIGLPVGETAILVGMQPIITALVMHRSHLIKILLTSILGFIGLICVLNKGDFAINVHFDTIIPALVALFGITFGTIYQKNKCSGFPIIILAFLQYIPALILFSVFSFVFESPQMIHWNGELIFALLWLSLVLSIGSILLLAYLYRKHSATKVANFFYLARLLALIQGYLFFGEPINSVNIIGIILVVVSLYFTNRVLALNKPLN